MKRLTVLVMACFFSISTVSLVEAKKKGKKTAEIVQFSTKKIDKKKISLKVSPPFSFKYPDNYHVHSYDGKSLNINDWDPKNYTNASMIIRWKKRPFSRKEESQYLKLGTGKTLVKTLSTRGVKTQNAPRIWAIKAKYNLEKKNPLPMMPPDSVKKAKAFTVKPYSTQVERTVLDVRCKRWHVLIDFQSKLDKKNSGTKSQIEKMAQSFRCG